MHGGCLTLIFDTSGLNALADDLDAGALMAGVAAGYFVRLTETNVAELVATRSAERRRQLIEVCQQLRGAGECVQPYNRIIEKLASAYAAAPQSFDWRRVNISCPELERELARPALLNNDSVSEEVRSDFKALNRSFEELYRGARERFPVDSQDPVSFPGTVDIAATEGGPFWTLAADMYSKAASNHIQEPDIRAFTHSCPPFNSLILALFVAQYHRCIRDPRSAAVFDAGRLDLLMAVYLSYCDWFVTNDPGQLNALSAVASIVGLSTRIVPYAEFRSSLLMAA